jgi:hypothetical protein
MPSDQAKPQHLETKHLALIVLGYYRRRNFAYRSKAWQAKMQFAERAAEDLIDLRLTRNSGAIRKYSARRSVQSHNYFA